PTPTDFDLMAHDYRPGDRSRREDDRYLFLEALLSARDQLYIGWNGRDIRDNSARPPSVLVGQLRDHLAAAWRPADGDGTGLDEPAALLDQLTVLHPLQPFSRANFPADGQDELFTYAREWRAALADRGSGGEKGDSPLLSSVSREDKRGLSPFSPLPVLEREAPVGPAELAAFLKNPVQAFCQQRLGVHFDDNDEGGEDVEPLALAGLEAWQARDELARAVLPQADHPAGDAEAALGAGLARLRRSGRLPPGALGGILAGDLHREVAELYDQYAAWAHAFPLRDPDRLDGPLELTFEHEGLRVEGWLAELRDAGGTPLRLAHRVSHLRLPRAPFLRFDHLAEAWLDHLLACAGGHGLLSVLVAGDTSVQLAPLAAAEARTHLERLLEAWRYDQTRPLPVTCQAACTWLEAQHRRDHAKNKGKPPDPDKAVRDFFDGNTRHPGEGGRNAYLQRLYPDADGLLADGTFHDWTEALYRPLFEAVERVDAPTTAPGEEATA
ncbi:MAG: exodeoxyribonuclease V subunit gamma, partial [Thiohalospira sp.]